jgi:hypothetical protein
MLTFLLIISFTYRCPRTALKVHGHAADKLIDGETYAPVACTACGTTHLVNPKTGRVLERARK